MRKFVFTLLSMLVFSFTSKPIFAETIKFATFDFAPYALRDDPDGRRGLFIDIDTAIAARAGITITDSVLPIARALKSMERGASDCSVFLLTPWSDANFIPVAKILHDRLDTVFVTRAGLVITRIEDLHGHRLSIPRGSFRDSPISQDPKIQRVLTSGYAQSVRLLKAGRVDAVAGSELSILYYLSAEGLSQKDIGVIVKYDPKQLWLHCGKGQLSDELLTKLEQATNSLRLEGAFENLAERYISLGSE